jgi:hypothetical protein
VTGALAQIIQQAGALAGMARETLAPKDPSSGRSFAANGHEPEEGDIPAATVATGASRKRVARTSGAAGKDET